MADESLCKSCKFGLVVSAVEGSEIDNYSFCNYLETPIKFTSGKVVVECTGYNKRK